jgi:hypothetical protein
MRLHVHAKLLNAIFFHVRKLAAVEDFLDLLHGIFKGGVRVPACWSEVLHQSHYMFAPVNSYYLSLAGARRPLLNLKSFSFIKYNCMGI